MRPLIYLLRQEPLGACPKCGGEVFEGPDAYVCEQSQSDKKACKFKISKKILEQAIDRAQAKFLSLQPDPLHITFTPSGPNTRVRVTARFGQWGALIYTLFAVLIEVVVIGLFATFSVQLFFMGMVGEYIAAIHTHTIRRPIVVERERINFDEPADQLPERRRPETADTVRAG